MLHKRNKVVQVQNNINVDRISIFALTVLSVFICIPESDRCDIIYLNMYLHRFACPKNNLVKSRSSISAHVCVLWPGQSSPPVICHHGDFMIVVAASTVTLNHTELLMDYSRARLSSRQLQWSPVKGICACAPMHHGGKGVARGGRWPDTALLCVYVRMIKPVLYLAHVEEARPGAERWCTHPAAALVLHNTWIKSINKLYKTRWISWSELKSAYVVLALPKVCLEIRI